MTADLDCTARGLGKEFTVPATEKKTESISFGIKLNARDLYGFNIYQTYTGFSGWFSIVIGVLLIGLGVINLLGFGSQSSSEWIYAILYIAMGIGIIAYVPVSLWGRVNATLKRNTTLSDTLNYEINSEGISVTQGEEAAMLPWDQVYKMTGSSKRVLIYSSRINAYVIPTEQLGKEKYEELKKVAAKHLPAYRNKMKEV